MRRTPSWSYKKQCFSHFALFFLLFLFPDILRDAVEHATRICTHSAGGGEGRWVEPRRRYGGRWRTTRLHPCLHMAKPGRATHARRHRASQKKSKKSWSSKRVNQSRARSSVHPHLQSPARRPSPVPSQWASVKVPGQSPQSKSPDKVPRQSPQSKFLVEPPFASHAISPSFPISHFPVILLCVSL